MVNSLAINHKVPSYAHILKCHRAAGAVDGSPLRYLAILTQTASTFFKYLLMTSTNTAFWRRLDLPGHDAASISRKEPGYELLGQSVFLDPRGPTALRYRLALNPDWSTIEGRITGFIGRRSVDTHIVRSPQGWTLNGTNYGMAEVVDLDLGFTPATNMAQLKRNSLAVNKATNFDVAWLDAGAEELQRLPQQYRRVSEFEYDYASPSVDYRATIVLAPSGFAAVYPGLWQIVR